jgi:hypothetical protein
MQEIAKWIKRSYTALAWKFHWPMRMTTRVIALLALVSLEVATMLIGATPALATPIYTPSDQDQAISSFLSAFYDPTNHFFYTDTQNHAEADLWTEAIDWKIVMDAYNRTKSANYNQMIGDIYNHVTSVYGANCGQWQVANNSNETLAWWAEASMQAYNLTNNSTYKTCAQTFFDKIYQSWDTTEAGGGIWTLNNQTTEKNMATNALAAMTAAQLSTILGNSSYLTKAQSIYSWIRSHLTNLSGTSGAVYDRYDNTSATINMSQFSDNYGLFIGTALALNDATKNSSSTTNGQSVNYLSDASTVANASLTNLTINGDGIIHYESDCGNNTSAGDTSNSLSGNNGNITNNGSFVNENNTCSGGTNERSLYKGIYAHYLGELAFNSNYAVSNSAVYGQVLNENAAIAWNDRLPSSNLVGADWAEPAPTGPIKSWEAAPAAEILQILPNNNDIATYQSEDATLQGGLSLGAQYAGYLSNSGYIQNWTQNGQSVSFAVSAPAAGTELLVIRYSAGAGNANRYLEVNGAQNTANIPTGPIYASGTSNSTIAQISFPGTDSWNAYDLDVVPVLLTQGNNTITLSFNSSQNSVNALNLDELTVTPGFPPPFAAASSNSVSPASTTITASTSTTNPASYGYYYAGPCDSGYILPQETQDRNRPFSSLTDNNAGRRINLDQAERVPTYFDEGSNVGKIGNSSRHYGNNVGDHGASFGNYRDNVGNRATSFGDHGDTSRNYGNNQGNRGNNFGDYRDNVGECGNRGFIPGQAHLVPDGSHTFGLFQPLHTSGLFQPLHPRREQSPYTQDSQPSHDRHDRPADASRESQPVHNEHDRPAESHTHNEHAQSADVSRESQLTHNEHAQSADVSRESQPTHNEYAQSADVPRESQPTHNEYAQSADVPRESQPTHNEYAQSADPSRESKPTHTPWNPRQPYAPAPGPIPTRTPKPVPFQQTKKSISSRQTNKSILRHKSEPNPN